MSAHTDTHEHGHGHDHAPVFLKTLIALLILTVITVAVSRVDLGAANVAVALVVASIKATLVATFFMHLKWDKPINTSIALMGFLFLGLLLTFTIVDIDNRTDREPAGLKSVKPAVAAPAVGGAAPAAASAPAEAKPAAH